jgi:hypothetical protein
MKLYWSNQTASAVLASDGNAESPFELAMDHKSDRSGVEREQISLVMREKRTPFHDAPGILHRARDLLENQLHKNFFCEI